LDSISEAGVRLTTMQLRYPRFIHAELMTHRVFTRNASSSRAVPVEKLIEEAATDPAIPERWGLHNKGMQDAGVMSELGQRRALSDWLAARDAAVATARVMCVRPERCSKQIINRILEPFTHISVIVTSTQWKNFYALRVHPDADPTMLALAEAMKAAHDASTPRRMAYGTWHLPYVGDTDMDMIAENFMKTRDLNDIYTLDAATTICVGMARKVSAARCARVSYLTHDGQRPTLEADIALADKLMTTPMHATPCEHQASPDRIISREPDGLKVWETPEYHGNFVGWRQNRKMFIGEAIHDNADIVDGRR